MNFGQESNNAGVKEFLQWSVGVSLSEFPRRAMSPTIIPTIRVHQKWYTASRWRLARERERGGDRECSWDPLTATLQPVGWPRDACAERRDVEIRPRFKSTSKACRS